MYQQMMAQQQAQAAVASGSVAVPAAPAPPEPLKIEPPTVKAPEDAVLVVFGSTNWPCMGKKPGVESEEAPNLRGPHREREGCERPACRPGARGFACTTRAEIRRLGARIPLAAGLLAGLGAVSQEGFIWDYWDCYWIAVGFAM